MPTVKVKVFGAGSLEVDGMDAKSLYEGIKRHYDGLTCDDVNFISVREIKRGPKKKKQVIE